MSEESAVRVAVRVRPFNGREKVLGAKLGIDMSDKSTMVYKDDVEECEEEPHTYTFDYSLWSHYDPETEQPGENEKRPDRPNVDQQFLYEQIGVKLLDDFWEGYDVCLFAYGQSGAGKSFSMTGTSPRCPPKMQGMIPRICKGTFEKAAITTESDPNISFNIAASMLEIYNDKIYDLLIPPEEYNVKTRKDLQMMLDEVEGLRWEPVATTDEVIDKLIKGFTNQYKAPTGLNVDSSRGHTIYTLKVERIVKNPLAKKKKDRVQVITTNMKLVDLAGSERAEKVSEITKAQLASLLQQKYGKPFNITDEQMAAYKAERSTEGKSINKSLSELGNCVKQVAKLSEIKDEALRNEKMQRIGWRNTGLTRLLKTALNGKCKTIMIAAISPSTSEYPETISTMRYADNIKQIKSSAVKKVAQETPEQILQRKIKELEEQLAKAMAGGGGGAAASNNDGAASAEVLQQLKEMKEKEAEAKRREEKLAREMEELRAKNKAREQIKEGPHLITILSSELSAGLYVTALPQNKNVVAAHNTSNDNPDIPLLGAGVSKNKVHCTFVNEGSDVIKIIPEPQSACMVNGKSIKDTVQLHHNDRIRLGANNFFRVIIPNVMNKLDEEQRENDEIKYNYEYLKQESMKEVFEAFNLEDDKEAEEKRKKAVEEELAKREKEFQKQQEEAKRKADEEKRLFEQQMLKLQEQYANSSNSDKEALAKIAREKEEFEKKMRENELMLKSKLEEEENYKREKLKEEEKAAKKRATAKAKLQYDLMDAIPFVRTANEYAAELNINVRYEVKIVQEESAEGSNMEVNVQIKDNITNKTETWDMDTFRGKYGEIMQDYYNCVKALKAGQNITLSPESPFRVNDNALTTIGNAKCMLNYIFYNMEINDKFHIVSSNGSILGSIHLHITPIWKDEAQEDEVLEADNLYDIKSLKYLDLDFSLLKCEALPPNLACDVICSFELPDFIQTSIIDPEEAKLRARAKELRALKKAKKNYDDDFLDDDDADEDEMDDTLSVRGAKYESDGLYENHGTVQINAPINWNKRIRIHNIGKRVIEWFKDSSLIIKVRGRGPKGDNTAFVVNSLNTNNNNNNNTAQDILIDGMTPQQIHEKLLLAEKERENILKELEEAKRQAEEHRLASEEARRISEESKIAAQEAINNSNKVIDVQQAAVVEAVKNGKLSADGELRKEVLRLQEENRKAEENARLAEEKAKQYAEEVKRIEIEAQNKTIALQKIVDGQELGSVRYRIKDVNLPEKINNNPNTVPAPVPVPVPESSNKNSANDAKVQELKRELERKEAELKAMVENEKKRADNEKKRADKAEADLKKFKAEWDEGETDGDDKQKSKGCTIL